MTHCKRRIYFDANAGSPLCEPARVAMIQLLDATGNGSSLHWHGRRARAAIDRARQTVARFCGAEAENVIFTSGGSEANATVLTPRWHIDGGMRHFTRLYTSATEHPSILAGGRFGAADRHVLNVDGTGRIDPDGVRATLEEALQDGRSALVSVMAANNETGVLQPVDALARQLRDLPVLIHVDAIQLAGRADFDIASLGADVITLSAHKAGGPQGAGAIVFRSPARRPCPLLRGGGQEFSHRAGTQNTLAIAGFGAALQAICEAGTKAQAHMAALRSQFARTLRDCEPRAEIFSEKGPVLCNTICFSAPGTDAETSLIALDLAGISVSSGAACSSGKVGASHVLEAMNVPPAVQRAALRVSFHPGNTEAEIAHFFDIWPQIAARQRGRCAA